MRGLINLHNQLFFPSEERKGWLEVPGNMAENFIVVLWHRYVQAHTHHRTALHTHTHTHNATAVPSQINCFVCVCVCVLTHVFSKATSSPHICWMHSSWPFALGFEFPINFPWVTSHELHSRQQILTTKHFWEKERNPKIIKKMYSKCQHLTQHCNL